MFNKWLGLLFFLFYTTTWAQESSTFVRQSYAITSDTIQLSPNSINNAFFKITDTQGTEIDSSAYWVDFSKAQLVFKPHQLKNSDSIRVRYLPYPQFLTQEYRWYDKSRIVTGNNVLQSIQKETRTQNAESPFEGLNTSGSITRGLTIGNNQNAVVNSVLDLQISGKISDNITLRASIQDNNIPIQNNGYSQKLDQFDQVFIELAGNQWNIRAGDLFLENRKLSVLNFNKKVQGVATQFEWKNDQQKTTLYNSIGIVRGQYAKSSFTGTEGNQGPYKLKGSGGELYILVISGSERVFVNGLLLQRGENKHYMIDYNAGEIIFNATYPITSEMRIVVEYQYSDRNYNRFITYNGATHTQKNWYAGGYYYGEGDLKNQSLQQSLSNEQKQTLSLAGDNPALMNSPSAVPGTFTEDKVWYKKTLVNGVEIFEYTTNPNDQVFQVRFTFQGNNQGNYRLVNATAVQKIYEYIAPIGGIKQGSYEPIIKLIPPINLQIGAFEGGYKKEDKTLFATEIGVSKKDQNLFSNLDDQNNIGVAGKFQIKQRLYEGTSKVDAFSTYQIIQQRFTPVERLFSIEFDRDWNLNTTYNGNQQVLSSGIQADFTNQGKMLYQHDYLSFGNSFSGNKHSLLGHFQFNKWKISETGSVMKSQSNLSQTQFIRNQTQLRFHWNKNWTGATFRAENNQERLTATQQLSGISQRFSEYGYFIGRGDSTKVFTQLGYLHRLNDSVVSGNLQRVNYSQSYYLKSKLIQNEKNDLSLFINYRKLNFQDPSKSNIPSLNSRLLYNAFLWQQLVQSNTLYETLSGTVAQQDFTYLEVDAGRGVYTWIDYNNNGIQELSEFEVAQFIDQAKFVRVFLPNQIYIKTHQNKFSQTLTLNPLAWQSPTGIKKTLAHFYNQTAYLIERKLIQSNNGFDLNPFGQNGSEVLGLNTSIRNSLFYNRGKQHHSVTYNYLQNQIRNLLSIGLQENRNVSHQILYNHVIQKSWTINSGIKSIHIENFSENFENRNYIFKGYQFSPKIGYLFTKETSVDVFYEYQQKHNQINNLEKLNQQRLGVSFTYVSSQQFSANGEVSLYENNYEGPVNSPIIYQLLEGLLPGKNWVWRLLVQRNITNYLDVNLNYQGRQNETSKTIHTGSVQLRAHF